MFTKILVPLDGSDVAEHALAPAAALARACSATLVLLCACAPKTTQASLQPLNDEKDWFQPEEINEPAKYEAKNYLSVLAQCLSRQNVKIQGLVIKGDEAGAIIGIAEAQDIDLIVMTKHGRSGARHHLLGEATERVLHHASCSVLVVSPTFPGELNSAAAVDPAENMGSMATNLTLRQLFETRRAEE